MHKHINIRAIYHFYSVLFYEQTTPHEVSAALHLLEFKKFKVNKPCMCCGVTLGYEKCIKSKCLVEVVHKDKITSYVSETSILVDRAGRLSTRYSTPSH